MERWRDGSLLAAFMSGLTLGRIEAKIDRILLHQERSRSRTSSSRFVELLSEWGRGAVKEIFPYLTPYLWALLTGIGALAVGFFKAFTRGWLG
jgi:hypothetical protein